MKVVPIISSIIVVIGCFMPWFQLGALFANRGVDGPDGAIMLVGGVIAGGLSIFNYTKDKDQSVWIYLLVGVLGIIVAAIDLNDVHSRAEIIAEELGALDTVFGGDGEVSIMNFVGSGLYILFFGSVGLILSSLIIFKFDPETESSNYNSALLRKSETESTTKVCPECAETIKKEAKVCRFCQYRFSEEELKVNVMSEEEKEYKRSVLDKLTELRQMVLSEKQKFLGGGLTDEMSSLMTTIFTSKEVAYYLLEQYEILYSSNLVEELKSLNTSYLAIRNNVSVLIDLDVVEEVYPHNLKM